MKKLLALTLAVMMLFTLVACATEEPAESSAPATSSTAPTTSSTAPESSEEAPESSEEAPESSEEEPTPESSEEESSEEPVPEEPVENPYEELEIGKATTAPVIDGVATEDEYATVIYFDELDAHWNASSYGEGLDVYDVAVYLSWDEEYLYSCVQVIVGNERTYDNTDFTANRPYIFDRRHVMSAIVLGDPCLPKYQPADGESWAWGDAYSSGLGTEWSLSAQPDGSPIKADHFGALTTSDKFAFVVGVSQTDYEYYEQKIPWSALQGGASFTAEEGVKIGYSFVACVEEVDITVDSDETAKYINFGAGINGYKNFGEYVGMTLVG